jgi:DNA helicase-2/ATP-dependent DNA helicase PcrA
MDNIISKNETNLSQEQNIPVKKYVLKKSTAEKTEYKIDYEAELNENQLYAVTHTEGAMLVIAGAGSGKTRTLIYRVARLVESGVDPKNILLLTFTRKTAQEMLDRATAILDSRCENIAGGTFHSFANVILRKYSATLGLKNSFTILDRSDAEDAINLLRAKYIDNKKQRFPRKSTITDIYSKAVNKNISANQIIEEEYPQFIKCTDQIIEICQNYADYKRQNSLLDYDDLLLYLKTLLTSDEKIRRKLSDTYKYIMIDEYQDTNSLQADIIRLLACTHNNVMAVGDDSQSIYSFRGANFKNIMSFPDIFENTKIIKLEQNYRSTQQILDVANEVIKHSQEKFSKNLFTQKTGETPAIIAACDQKVESEFISQRILELTEEGISLKDIAVLARSARTTYDLEIELNKKNIPFKKFGGYKFIETAHIKDVISHLRVITNNDDQISWNRILLLINGVGNVTSSKLVPLLANPDNNQDNLSPLMNKNNDGIKKLLDLIKNLRTLNQTPSEIAEAIIQYYYPLLAEKYDDYNKRMKDLEHFQYMSENYRSLESFLSDLALEPPNSSFLEVEQGAFKDEFLTLSTIHSAKGLEWNAVFVVGAVEGRFPSVYSYNNMDDLEEERRLMYVAATRAKNYLYITYPIDMFDHSLNMTLSMPSRFLEQIPENILEKWCLVEE